MYVQFVRSVKYICTCTGCRFIFLCYYVSGYCTECQPNVKKGLPEMCVQACATARDRLQSLLSSVQSGEISISTLREVDSYQEQMEGLCSALLAQQGESMSTLSAVKGAITKRIAEYNYFIKDRDRLLHLCHSIASDIENRKEVIIMGK